MENKLNKQLAIYIVLLAIVWFLLLSLQIRLASKAYSKQKDLFAVKLTDLIEEALSSVETVDYPTLDSLITISLENHDIPSSHDLGVYSDDEQRFLFLTDGADPAVLLEMGFSFPLVLVVENRTHMASILLHFPGLVRKFRRETILGYSVIIALLILLLCCFINFFYIILKQRKLFLFREKMAHFITHEVKTPLTTINLSAQLLKDDSVVTDETTKKEYLDVITEETKVLESLVDEVLTVFRLESVPEVETADVAMHRLLNEVCKILGPKLDECEAEVHCEFHADRDVVAGNYTHLFNAFSNLVDNAVKYRNGHLRLAVCTRNVDNGIEISVADNGIGISEENLQMVFEPFTRFNTDNTHYVKGFGVGLNYVKHIIEHHKGTIAVESQLGIGTKFIVTLPLKNK